MRRVLEVAVGQRFGRGVVLSESRVPNTPAQIRRGSTTGQRGLHMLCDCGNEYTVNFYSVYNGLNQSCGCGQRDAHVTHGLSYDPLFKTWEGMMRRCYNSEDKDYHNYGGRGIQVFGEWHNVAKFIEWMNSNLGPKPTGCSIDRVDNNQGYEPGNVQWSTATAQAANRRVRKDSRHVF
jgi:hypothetical protein